MRKMALLLLAASLTLAGCASSQKAGVYQTGQVQTKMKVVLATVIDVREVDIEATPTGGGTGAGAAAGAVIGSGSGSGKGAVVGAIGGAVVGGVAGTLAERAVNSKKGIEIIYRPEGSTDALALVQEKDEANDIRPGDRVRILESQFNVRAVRLAQAGQ